jgi:hypothetical protein
MCLKMRLLGLNFFGKMRGKIRNIVSPNGYFVHPKRPRWMDILNLKHQNDCLLSNWLFRLINIEGT